MLVRYSELCTKDWDRPFVVWLNWNSITNSSHWNEYTWRLLEDRDLQMTINCHLLWMENKRSTFHGIKVDNSDKTNKRLEHCHLVQEYSALSLDEDIRKNCDKNNFTTEKFWKFPCPSLFWAASVSGIFGCSSLNLLWYFQISLCNANAHNDGNAFAARRGIKKEPKAVEPENN